MSSTDLTLKVTNEKRAHILQQVDIFLKKKYCKIVAFAKLIGHLVAICPAVNYGWLYTKTLECYKKRQLRRHNFNYGATMPIDHAVKRELLWWKATLPTAIRNYPSYVFVAEIFTDASLSGWDACRNNDRINGVWSINDKSRYIIELELLAVLLALQNFANNEHDCEILIRCDNTTAIAYINRMGGTHNQNLLEITKKIWKFCEKRSIWIYSSYIASADNKTADALSRISNPLLEWNLNYNCFEQICSAFGQPNIDLFASAHNAKCDQFVAWHNSAGSCFADAFSISWKDLSFYAFPPFAIVLRTLQKIITDKAEGIVVVPLWETQPFFPMFTALLTKKPIVFKPQRNLLLSPSREPHPLYRQLSLVAGVLSGKVYGQEAYRIGE